MISATDHIKEKERLVALESYSILDTLPEEEYDNLTAIAAEICGTPISLISLLDSERQWFKSHHGLDVRETPKEYAFCAHAINDQDDVFIVQDSRTDTRFKNNPLVTGDPLVIFYAGIPLNTAEGLPVGTLCVIDHKPRLLSQGQINSLKALAGQVMILFQLRKNNNLLKRSVKSLEEKNEELERFAYVAAHDLKAPLNNISSMSKLFSDSYAPNIDGEGLEMLDFINSSANNLKGLIDGLLDYSRSESILNEVQSNIDLEQLKNDIGGLYAYENNLSLILESKISNVVLNKSALQQILMNLVGNAIKYDDKENVEIKIGVSENPDYYKFYVQDNGPGIPLDKQDKIFQIFKILDQKDKYGRKGNGIGLATVKKLIEKMDGNITLKSSEGSGCRFIFCLKK